MRILKGIAASSGIGIGRAFLYVHEKLVIPHTHVPSSQAVAEKARFQHALKTVATELERMLGETEATDHHKILETHLLMLSDPEFIRSVENRIETEHLCAEWSVESVLSKLIEMLETAGDPVLRERSADLYDVGWRVIREMMGKRRPELASINEEVVLVADTLLPSEALSLDHMNVKAIALNGGGRTSHVAILARALQIPTVVGLGKITAKVRPGDEIIVDGNLGEVAIRPSSASANKMRDRYTRWLEHEQELQELAAL